ncbi:hypothetical protein ABT034_34020 [Streptomyces sp. NPDC002773]|uniref:hypothetical protein n=1 Tax=Streptomyces sp. NPDC002773 TaxID=3154430 RepID=UPI00332C1CE7
MALVSAVATLLAALFFCLGAEPDGHHEAADRAGPQPGARAVTLAGGGTAGSGATVRGAAVREYVCPYDRGGCSLFPSLSPAVLSAPPLDPPLHTAGGPPRLDPPSGDGPARRSGAQPRAPDLHVLQVLRT